MAGIVKGAFEVRGINSNVSAFATYVYNIASQYNLYMGKNVTGTDLIDNIEEVSYAGSVAGMVLTTESLVVEEKKDVPLPHDTYMGAE